MCHAAHARVSLGEEIENRDLEHIQTHTEWQLPGVCAMLHVQE